MNNQVLQITSINSVSVLVRIITGLISTSIIAKILGPLGVALLGNLRNFITSVETISMLGFNNGIVKYVARYKDEKQEYVRILSTVFYTILFVSILVGIVLYTFSEYWNNYVFGNDRSYINLFKWFALSIPFFSLNIFLTSILNGLSQYKRLIYLNIISNIVGFILSILLIVQYKVEGALYGLIIIPALLTIITILWVSKEVSLTQNINIRYFDVNVIRKMSSYSVMAFVSAFCSPIIYLKIRVIAIDSLGIDTAGNWEAMNRISSFYMMFVSTLLSVYFFPRLSQSSTSIQTKGVFKEYFKTVVPMFILGGLLLYVGRDLFIRYIYSDKFVYLSDLFLWQLVGDLLKVCSLILGYEFFAKKLTKLFLISEIVSLFVLYLSSVVLLQKYNVQGLVMAHAFTYLVYLVMLIVIFRRIIFQKKSV